MNKIKELRKLYKLNQTEFAKKFNITQQTVSNWENEITDIDIDSLTSISKYFNVSIDYLLGRTNTVENIKPLSYYNITSLPIIGSISAGYDGVAQEEEYLGEVGVLDLALRNYDPSECFVLKVKGNSMYPDYKHNDLVLVHKQEHVDSGAIAVVLYNGDEATLKKVNYIQGEDWLELIPRNPEYETKIIKGEDLQFCKIIGKVISLILRQEN